MMRCWTLKSSNTEPRSIRDQVSGRNGGAKASTAVLAKSHAPFNWIREQIEMNESR